MFTEEEKNKTRRSVRKITKQRLKNIGLYYLQRFETSTENLRQVLYRRIQKYAFQNPEFNRGEAEGWVEEVLAEFQNYGYISDERYAELKVKNYMAAGKSLRYIQGKLKAKGIDENLIEQYAEEQEYDPFAAAMRLARKKHLGPFRRDEEERRDNRQKDMRTLVAAGFDYETVMAVLDSEQAENAL